MSVSAVEASPSRGPVARWMRRGLHLAQELVYGAFFRTSVHGRENVPSAPGFLVVANHASHLDKGLIDYALGGRGLAALAARDYWFRYSALHWFFIHVAELVPVVRGGGSKDAIQAATRVLRRGRNLMIFPEATRSLTGAIAPFKPTVGYLALRSRASVLPVYIEGAFESLPKGSLFPRSRALRVHIGRAITHEELRRRSAGLAPKDAARAAAAMIEETVRRLESRARAKEWAVRSR